MADRLGLPIFGEPMGDREASRLGRVEDVGVVPWYEGTRRGGSRGEAIVDMFQESMGRCLLLLIVVIADMR